MFNELRAALLSLLQLALVPLLFCMSLVSRAYAVAAAIHRATTMSSSSLEKTQILTVPILAVSTSSSETKWQLFLQRIAHTGGIVNTVSGAVVSLLVKLSLVSSPPAGTKEAPSNPHNVGRSAPRSAFSPTRTSAPSSSAPIFVDNIRNYDKLCDDCHAVFSLVRFPSVVVIEPPPLLASSSSSNSIGSAPFPACMKYSMSNIRALTVQLFLVLCGVPFAVARREELLLPTGNSAVEIVVARPIRKKSTNDDQQQQQHVEIIKHFTCALDTDDLLEQLVMEMRPYVEDLVMAEPSMSAAPSSAASASNYTPNRGAVGGGQRSTTTGNHHHPQQQPQLLRGCCEMRERLGRLTAEAEPFGSASQQLSLSDTHRAVMMRRVINLSIAPVIEHAVVHTASRVHQGASHISAPNSLLRSVLFHLRMVAISKSSAPLDVELLTKALTSTHGAPAERMISVSSSSRSIVDAKLEQMKHRVLLLVDRVVPKFVPRLLNKTWVLIRFAPKTVKTLFDHAGAAAAAATATFPARPDDDALLHARLAADLQLLERFIGGAKTKFLFDCETPTLVDATLLAMCLAAVHAENVPGLYDAGSSSSEGDERHRQHHHQPKLRCLYSFARKRSVKAWMERSMAYFYPGSVIVSATTSSSKQALTQQQQPPPPTPPSNTDDDDISGGGSAAGGNGSNAGAGSTKQTRFVTQPPSSSSSRGDPAKDAEAAVKQATRVLTAPLRLSPLNLERHSKRLGQSSGGNSRAPSVNDSNSNGNNSAQDGEPSSVLSSSAEQAEVKCNKFLLGAAGGLRRVYRQKLYEQELLSSFGNNSRKPDVQ